MIYPIKNWEKRKRGYRFHSPTFYTPKHLGVDIMCPEGEELVAPEDGVATKVVGKEIGNAIYFQGQKLHRFLHLSEYVKTGKVKEGELMAYTGNTGLSTGPHCHVDISKGKLNIKKPDSFIDPDIYYKSMMEPIQIKILASKEYDWEPLKGWLRDRGVPFYLTTGIYDGPVQWRDYTTLEGRYVDETWYDSNIGHLGGKADIILLCTKDWQAPLGIFAYGKPEQRLGQWRCYMREDESITSQASTIPLPTFSKVVAHELCHLIYAACGYEDKTHELDYSNQSNKLLEGVDFGRFKHFAVKDGMRFFYKNDGKIEERIIYSSIANLFASGYNYWRRVFGFTDTIPKI